jgi:hypothetical protein
VTSMATRVETHVDQCNRTASAIRRKISSRAEK